MHHFLKLTGVFLHFHNEQWVGWWGRKVRVKGVGGVKVLKILPLNRSNDLLSLNSLYLNLHLYLYLFFTAFYLITYSALYAFHVIEDSLLTAIIIKNLIKKRNYFTIAL